MRYSERARQAIRFAHQETARLGHDHISTGHLLLGLIRQGEGAAIQILKDANVDLEKIKSEIESLMEDRGRSSIIGKIQFSSKANEVLKYAEKESDSMGHKYVGTEHILIGLLLEAEGIAGKALAKYNIDINHVRAIAQSIEANEEGHSETLTFHSADLTLSATELKDNFQRIYTNNNDVLNLEEASRLLRIKVEAFEKLLATERIPARMIDGEWRFNRASLLEWLGTGNSLDYIKSKTEN
ncbi:MAG: Clp protease N-terminal domain-containing protein [bacterium]